MRARAAYIRSLGTTSILVVAALLMLGVVGALVGFHGWPEGAVGGTVASVPLQAAPEPVLSQVRQVRQAPAVSRAARVVGDRTATAGLVKQAPVPVSSPQPVGYPESLAPGQVAPTSDAHPPATPAQNAVDPTAAAPPSDPAQVQALINQLLGSAPPGPVAPGDQQPIQVGIPLVGLTLSVPPAPSR
jgi:hypothetical protein